MEEEEEDGKEGRGKRLEGVGVGGKWKKKRKKKRMQQKKIFFCHDGENATEKTREGESCEKEFGIWNEGEEENKQNEEKKEKKKGKNEEDEVEKMTAGRRRRWRVTRGTEGDAAKRLLLYSLELFF